MSWKQVLPIGLVLVLSGSGLGQTYVEGDVSGVWSLTGSPYIVIGDCNVLEGTTLTIEPGVEVQFSGLHYILVVGTLVAEGTRSDTIVFTSYGTVHNPGDWRYVKINGSSAQDSRFKYCDVSYAQWGIWVADSECEIRRCGVHGSDGGIKINNSDVTVERCHLYGNNDQGVYASGSSSITVRRCLVEDNNDEGIETGGSTGGFIEWNSVFRNGLQGILVDGASNMWVNRNAVADNLHGLYFQDAHVSAKHNSISNNDQHGVFFLNSQLIFSSNIVDRNGNRGLYNINSVAVLSFNDVWANGTNYEGCSPGAGSFSDDPRYVSDPFDFHLQSDSPCIDAGDPSSPLDPDGTRADVGAYYYDQNNPPEILSYGPETLDTVYLDDEVTFWISASDPDGDSLRYEWWHLGNVVGEDSTVTIQFAQVGLDTVVGKVLDGWGGGEDSVWWAFEVVDLGVPEPNTLLIPDAIWLGAAYPNPFNAVTVIPFGVSCGGDVNIILYDVLGREVRRLFQQYISPGYYSVRWEAGDVPSGVYFVALRCEDKSQVRKVVLLK